MKNFTILIGLGMCLWTSSISAQQRAGIKAGISYTGLSGYEGGKTINAHAGVFSQWALNKKWQLRPELIWSAAKQEYTVEENEGVANRTLTMQFASVPVLFRYLAGSKFYIEAGPQLSVLVSAKDVSTGGAKADVKRSLRSTDFSFNTGAGALLGEKAELFIRYSFGLSDLTLYDTNSDYTRILQAGVAFSLK